MQIYQIHEYSGSYEDYRDKIVGTYLCKEKANEETTRLIEFENKKSKKEQICNNCPIWDEEATSLMVSRYCEDFKPYEDGFDEYHDCKNRITEQEDCSFEIKEETVICECRCRDGDTCQIGVH